MGWFYFFLFVGGLDGGLVVTFFLVDEKMSGKVKISRKIYLVGVSVKFGIKFWGSLGVYFWVVVVGGCLLLLYWENVTRIRK